MKAHYLDMCSGYCNHFLAAVRRTWNRMVRGVSKDAKGARKDEGGPPHDDDAKKAKNLHDWQR